MRKYWNKMPIKKSYGNTNKDSIFISFDIPVFLTEKGQYTVRSGTYTEDELKKIALFYQAYFRLQKNTIALLFPESYFIDKINLEGEILTLYDNNDLIGGMYSLAIPLHLKLGIKDRQALSNNIHGKIENIKRNPDDIIFGCATHLMLRKKYRSKGLGMLIIQKSSELSYKNGCFASYFINTVSRCDNSLPLLSWYYSFNKQKLENFFPNKGEQINEGEIEQGQEIKYIDENNYEESLNFFFDELGKKEDNIYFSPSLEYWKKWTKCFPTYIVLKNSKIVGLFMLKELSVRHVLYNTTINQCSLLYCIGEQPLTLRSAISECRKKFDLLKVFELGDLSSNLLSSNSFSRMGKNYINFFNFQIRISAKNFYLPIF